MEGGHNTDGGWSHEVEGGHNTDGGWPHEMEDGHMRWRVVT